MANPGPVAAIRQFCLECQGNSSRSVRQCADEDCPLWGWRMAAIEAEGRPEWHGPDAPRRALRVIRGQCMMCAGSRADVRQCAARGRAAALLRPQAPETVLIPGAAPW